MSDAWRRGHRGETTLTDVLGRLYEILPAAKEIVIYVQADNLTENKNKVVFAVEELLMVAGRQLGYNSKVALQRRHRTGRAICFGQRG